MGLFGGGASAPDLRPFLDIMKKSVTNAEGKMSQYDSVIDNFTNMGLDRYNASMDLFGPWQERMNSVYQHTTASNYASAKNQNMASQLRQFNKRANDKFFAAGIPMGPSVGQQRGLNQEIMQAQYSAQNDFSAKHEVAQIHSQAMQTGDYAMQAAFNQMTAGVNMQQGVSNMYAANASNQQANAMSQATTSGMVGMSNQNMSMQRDQNMWSSVGQLAGMGAMYGMQGGFQGMQDNWNYGSKNMADFNAPMGQSPSFNNSNMVWS